MTANDEILKNFSSESQHSFSYAFISQSSISSRLDILKRSLEFLRSNPTLSNLGQHSSSSSTTALEAFFKSRGGPNAGGGTAVNAVKQQNAGHLRSSASSAALSMLTNYTSLNAAEPSLTAFDTNLKSILVLLENAHVFPSNSSSDLSPSSSHQNILSALQSDAAFRPPPSSPFKPIIGRAISNPPLLMSQISDSGIASPRGRGAPAHTLADIPGSQPGSNADLPSLMDPVQIRKRTKTNVASFHLQSQLLEALATPYMDGSWTSIIKRVGSLSYIPSAGSTASGSMASVSSLNLARRGGNMLGSTASLFHPLSSKFSSNQSVFTTSAEEPYTILTGNDMGCLIFGMSKSEIRKLTIIDLIGPSHKEEMRSKISESKTPNSVFICGEIVPIAKFNGQPGYGSFWAKHNKTNSIIAWVIEEVVCDRATIDVDLETGVVSNIRGKDKSVLFPYVDTDEATILIHDIVSGMPENFSELRARNPDGLMEHHVTISGKAVLPCTTQLVPCDSEKDQASEPTSENKKMSIELLSLPHMAGVIMIDTENFNIEDYNKPFVESLFGYSMTSDNCRTWNINELVPNFTDFISSIKETCDVDLETSNGLVIPEHLFRKVAAQRASKQGETSFIDDETDDTSNTPHKSASSSTLSEETKSLDSSALFMRSRGIEGLHKDGHSITIDIQLRTLGASFFALWITYSRNITGTHETNVPSQLSLLSVKKKMHRHHHSKSDTLGHGRHSSESSTNSTSAASLGSFTGLNSSNDNSSTKVSELGPRVPSSSSVPKLVTTNLPDEVGSQPKTPTSPADRRSQVPQAKASSVNQVHRTPREQILKPPEDESAPDSASSQYSIHIPELGARRREKTLEDFTILQKMGEGAYGKVLLVQYKEEPQLQVVLKCVIKERILVDTWTRDRKLGTIPSEIKVMAALNKWPHENIIQLLDFFEDDQFYHIEMEPHGNPGTDLFDLIELQPSMSEAQCKSIFKQLVAAVRHLHAHDIVHRDIKDENVIVDSEGAVKLIDFGSSAFMRQGPFDVFVGTIDYAAPEVLSGRPYEGKPQDIWALGILLYTIVYKENPFYSVDEIMDHELRIPFVLSEDCLDLVKKILVRDLRKRPTIEQIFAHPWIQDSK